MLIQLWLKKEIKFTIYEVNFDVCLVETLKNICQTIYSKTVGHMSSNMMPKTILFFIYNYAFEIIIFVSLL